MPFTKGHTLWNHPNCKKTQFKKGSAAHSMPHTPQARRKMSLSRMGQGVGAKNGSWKGGITPLLIKIKRLTEYKDWQKRVFKRDNYTCRSCFKRGRQNITAHHLVSFSFIVRMLKVRTVEEARKEIMLWNIRNGVTLCDDCHKDTSNYSWRASKTPRDRTIYKPVILSLLLLCFFLPQNSEAATFGYTSIGASETSLTTNTGHFSSATADASVDLDSLSIYGRGGVFKGVVFSSPTYGSPETGTLISNGATSEADYPVSSDWTVATFPTKPSVSASANYWLASFNGGTNIIAYDDIGSNIGGYDSSTGWTYPTAANVNNNFNFSNRQHSIYATYTAAAGGAEGPIQQSELWF